MLVGYARVSTNFQDAGLEAQVRDLEAAGCDAVCKEQVSSVGHRPVFEQVVGALQAGDTLVVTKIDRFARSNIGFWKTVEEINAKGAYLRVLNLGGETIDTKSATGRLILTVFAGFAQFEREIMLERQAEGIAKAKLEGRYHGRAPTAKVKTPEIMALYGKKWPKTRIATKIGISRSSVHSIIAAARM